MSTRVRLQPDDGDPRHGTINGYCNLRCRCELCRRTWRTYTHDLRRIRVVPPAADARHGKESTYTNYGCRCQLCREAHSWGRRERQMTTKRPDAVAPSR